MSPIELSWTAKKFFSTFSLNLKSYFQTMSVDSSESASASDGVYDDLEYLNLIYQVFRKKLYFRYIKEILCLANLL